WTAVYFTSFLALWQGQTPGKRMVGLRVIRLDGRPMTWWLAFERFGGYAASLSIGLLGFLQILWDRNRQGLHDKGVGTVVVREPDFRARMAAREVA
ncbi:MAG TPA: RDD family protein, partial [Longimicrobiales bacterium]|nr:RDD family protein [Longimicrobiales bacterium]